MTITAEKTAAPTGTTEGPDFEKLRNCIEACYNCAQTCTACADSCLGEKSAAELAKCIRTCLDCADLCDTTGRILSRHTGYDATLARAVLEACIAACTACATECGAHAQTHPHCQVCADASTRCLEACQDLLAAL